MARLKELAASIEKKFDVAAIAIESDLSNHGAHLRILAEIEQYGRYVDVLVNNAGYGIASYFAQTTWEAQSDFISVSVVNVCGLAHGVVAGMIERGHGSIINVGSLLALVPELPGYTLYPAAKSFVLKFSFALREEVHRQGVSVTVVCPGYTLTEFHRVSGTEPLIGARHRLFSLSSVSVAEAAIAGSNRGKALVIPGWHNKVAFGLIKVLPSAFIRPFVRALSVRNRKRGANFGIVSSA
jgi:short-subunit dehydrogenase